MAASEEDRRASGFAAEIAFLSQPQSYGEPTARVDTVETHLSWVFLTAAHAWKLKKPVRTAFVDFRDVAARARNCRAEVRLNRRLSSGVYLGTVPLFRHPDGTLGFAPGGEIVDWLVKMRRLPAERMLDRLLGSGGVRRADIAALVDRLFRFYRECEPAKPSASAYRRGFALGIEAHRRELADPAHGLAADRIEAVSALQRDFLAAADGLDARLREGRVVEGHGDLRPEHVCLEDPPQIIDCLEFSRRLRIADVADELGYLALECERLGAPRIGSAIIAAYRERSGDPVPETLLHFYQSFRAALRATLAIRHLDDPRPHDAAHWLRRAGACLDLALHHARRCR